MYKQAVGIAFEVHEESAPYMVDRPLHRLVERLNIPNKETIIDLGEGIHWLGFRQMAQNELYVRSCCLEILAAREEYIERNPSQPSGCDSAITGTPGE